MVRCLNQILIAIYSQSTRHFHKCQTMVAGDWPLRVGGCEQVACGQQVRSYKQESCGVQCRQGQPFCNTPVKLRLISLSLYTGIRRPTVHPILGDVGEECYQCRAGFLDNGQADQRPVSGFHPKLSSCCANDSLISMGSTSTPSGAAKSSTVTPGQSVQQQQSSGCC